MELWKGRFSKEIDSRTNDFNSSIKVDSKMYKQDILGSIAHSKMLAKQGIISEEDGNEIKEGLENILRDIESNKLLINPNAEDIHTFVEEELTNRIGDAGKRLHTARSRNDQVALDIKLYLRDQIEVLTENVESLVKTLIAKAEENLETVMPGYTHMQRAQTVTFGHYMMAYVEMFLRDIKRLKNTYEEINIMPLGSSALAGTTYNIDREFVASELGFADITHNSLDGVSDRDHIIDLESNIAILMMHLSRLSEEIVLWSSWEFKFVELDDAFSTGSSIMPQKKNPDITELIRGKTGRTYGNLMQGLTMMKALPLAYNKDMQEDKEAVMDSVDTANICLITIIPMIETMQVLKDNMKNAVQKGFINATDCADYLTKKGMPFRSAYKLTGEIVKYCIENNKTFNNLSIEEYQNFSDMFENDIYDAVDLMNCVMRRKTVGGPAPEQVKAEIERAKKELNN